MATTAVVARRKRIGLFVLPVALLPAFFIFAGSAPAASIKDAPQTGNWEHQAPYPTRYGVEPGARSRQAGGR